MAVFFLLVGLEIKREMLDGRLRTWPDRILPGIAALGGMLMPALVYAAVNRHSPETLRGWAIRRRPTSPSPSGCWRCSVRACRSRSRCSSPPWRSSTGLGAVLIIAAFYTADLSLPMLGGAGLTLAALYGMNKAGVARLWPYLLLGAVLWVFVLKSGVHATIAGVLLALTIRCGSASASRTTRPRRCTSSSTPSIRGRRS